MGADRAGRAQHRRAAGYGALALLRSTPAAARSQIAVIDRNGGAAVLTGSDLEPGAGDFGRPGVCAVTNLMERLGVARVAVLAYATSRSATFEGRLLAALSAADRMGSDVRGRQSAALRVVSPRKDGGPSPHDVDLRVDDARDPVGELRRLHRLASAHRLLDAGRNGARASADREPAFRAELATAPVPVLPSSTRSRPAR